MQVDRRHLPPSQSSRPHPVPVDLIGRCFNCLETDHVVAVCRNRSRCLRCKQEGHQARQCSRPRSPLEAGTLGHFPTQRWRQQHGGTIRQDPRVREDQAGDATPVNAKGPTLSPRQSAPHPRQVLPRQPAPGSPSPRCANPLHHIKLCPHPHGRWGTHKTGLR